MNQAELRKLAEERIKDASALIDCGRWEFAYYAAGYAVECALKSCLLARMIHTGWVFQQKKKIEECWTHDFNSLCHIAGIKDELGEHLKANEFFSRNWETVLQWDVSSRYETKTEADARAHFAAITDEPDGVFLWLRNYW